jgi:hypothetical protein
MILYRSLNTERSTIDTELLLFPVTATAAAAAVADAEVGGDRIDANFFFHDSLVIGEVLEAGSNIFDLVT